MKDRLKKLIVLRGVPASGKSTFSKRWVDEDPTTRVRVSRDDIRRALGPYWVPSREKLVTKIEDDMIDSALLEGFDVMVDATNVDGPRTWWRKMVNLHYKTTLEIVDMPYVPFEELIKRDSEREYSVGQKVIEKFYKKLWPFGG